MKTSSGSTILSLLLGAALSAGAAGLPPQYAGTPTAKEYPLADVLILSETRAFTLQPDGRVTETVKRVEKILTYQGMDEIGDPKIAFQKENQDLVISRCRTYTAEGAVVDAKANSFNEMTPYELEKAPAYTSWRQMVVTKVGLDVNAVVEFEYTVADKKPWRRFLEGVEVLRNAHPALVREVSVTVPMGTDLKWKLLNATENPTTNTDAGQTTTTWTLKDIPSVNFSATSGPERDFLPTLLFTTCPDWARQASAVGALVEKAIGTTSPGLDKKAGDLLTGLVDPFEKAVKLQNYVAESINNVEWPLCSFDFVPRTAGQVYDSGYGNALDKAVLLCALLNKAGIEAAIAAGRKVPESLEDPTTLPCLSQMSGVVVHATVGKAALWLDPTKPLADSSQRNFQGFKGLPLLGGYGEIHTMPAIDAADTLTVSLQVTLAADLSFEGKGTVSLGGEYSPYFKVQGSKDAQKALLQGIVAGLLPGATLGEFSVIRLDPGTAVFEVAFKASAPPKGTVRALKTGLPEGSMLKGFHGSYLQQRDLPLILDQAGAEKIAIKFVLPEGMKPAFLPAPFKIETAGSKGGTGLDIQGWGSDARSSGWGAQGRDRRERLSRLPRPLRAGERPGISHGPFRIVRPHRGSL